MSVSAPDYLNSLFQTAVAMGEKAINSDAYFEIVGHEDKGIMIKQFPWPVLSVGEAIETAGPMGMNMAIPSQLRTYQQGAVTLYETKAGTANELFRDIIAQGGQFEAYVYEGTPQNYTRRCRIRKAFAVIDNPDRDWENRTQVLLVSGTLHFHYFGEN